LGYGAPRIVWPSRPRLCRINQQEIGHHDLSPRSCHPELRPARLAEPERRVPKAAGFESFEVQGEGSAPLPQMERNTARNLGTMVCLSTPELQPCRDAAVPARGRLAIARRFNGGKPMQKILPRAAGPRAAKQSAKKKTSGCVTRESCNMLPNNA
jgi:hypothetical protein